MFCAALLIAAPTVARADSCDRIKDAEAFNACLATQGPAARAVEADVASESRAPARAPKNPEAGAPRRAARRAPRSARQTPAATPVKAIGKKGRVRLEITPGQ